MLVQQRAEEAGEAGPIAFGEVDKPIARGAERGRVLSHLQSCDRQAPRASLDVDQPVCAQSPWDVEVGRRTSSCIVENVGG